MHIAGLVHRNRHTMQAHAPAPLAGTGSSFVAMMTGQHNDVAAASSTSDKSQCAALSTHPQSPAAAGTYGSFVGRSTGSGQCVALVRASNSAIGPTANWIRGEAVQGNASLQPGTAIATFAHSGRYANATDGSSHSAIYLGQTTHGMQVLDQWAGSPAAVRTIPWNNPGATAANTGCAFHVVNSVVVNSVQASNA